MCEGVCSEAGCEARWTAWEESVGDGSHVGDESITSGLLSLAEKLLFGTSLQKRMGRKHPPPSYATNFLHAVRNKPTRVRGDESNFILILVLEGRADFLNCLWRINTHTVVVQM